MKKRWHQSILLSCLFVYADKNEADISIVDIDENDGDFEDDYDIHSSEDLESSFVFPDSQQRKFPLGEIIDVLIGLKNTGDKLFNVTHIYGFLHFNQEFVIQNFTQFYYGSVLNKNVQSTFLYRFFPDPRLEPREYGVIISANYFDNDGVSYSSIVANTTINLYEPEAGYDFIAIFSTIAFIAAGIGVVYFFTGGIKTKSFMKPKVSEKGTETTEDLLAGSNFSPKTRRKKQD